MRAKKILRLVSKRFNDVVKYSSRLMHKYALNVSKISHDCEEPIDSFCQAMKFYNLSLNLDEFKCINSYQHKERIKWIAIIPKDTTLPTEILAIFVQFILFNFSALQEVQLCCDIVSLIVYQT